MTYSSFFDSFYERNLFSNLGNYFVKPLTQQNNLAINIKEINVEIELALKRLVKSKARKTATVAKKAEFAVAKKADSTAAKLKKMEAAEKRAIEKKVLKAEADMKKANDRAAKNNHTNIEKSETTKRKAALLIIDENATKKCQNNEKATIIEEKPENELK